MIERLDQMVRSGRVTEAEAGEVRASGGGVDFEEAIRKIRVRHAAAKLDVAVNVGGMSRDEADGYLDRLGKGDHLRSLRAHLRRLLSRSR